MYLSKVALQASTHARKELLNLQEKGVYGTHQLLWRLFSEEETRNFLYREEQGLGGLPHFFVLSIKPPEVLPELFEIQSKVFTPELVTGQRLGFKLRVNPTISKQDESGKSYRHDVMMHAKRTAQRENISCAQTTKHLMEQAALEWIANEKRLAEWGIQLDALPNIESYIQHRSKKKSGNTIQFSSVDFQGVLTVTKPEVFLNQYQKGFGRAKGLGCGLMLIRKI